MRKQRELILAALVMLVLVAGAPQVVMRAAEESPVAVDTGQQAPIPESRGELLEVTVTADVRGAPTVTLAGHGELDFESFVLEDPPRLVLDLHDVTSRLEEHHFMVGEGGVIRVRAGQYRRDPRLISRVVFDLERKVPYRIEPAEGELVVSFGEPVAQVTEPLEEEPALPEPETVAELPAAPEPVEAETTAVDVVETITEEPAPEPVVEEVVETATFDPAEPVVEPEVEAPPEPVPAEPETQEAAEIVQQPAPAEKEVEASRSVEPDALENLLRAPSLASEMEEPPAPAGGASFETKTIGAAATKYSGKRISLNLVDADIKQVFRLFHEISGLNFVLDPSVQGQVTIVLDNVPWDQALDIILKNNGLDKVLEQNVIRIATTRKLAEEAAQRKQLKEAKELEVEPITITRTLSYAKAKEVERVIREGGVLTPRGKVIVDERTNTLIVSDIPKKVSPLDQLITVLDTETPQVMIEARIVETSRQFIRDIGVQWGFDGAADAAHGTSTSLSFPHNITAKYGLNLGSTETGDVSGANSLAFTFGNVVDSFTLDVALDALETEGRGRILSSPKIATQNNERAEIEQGVRIPVVNTTATEINVEFVSASLKLGVTPQITAEGTIILDIQVENNSPDFVNTVGDVPPINTQRAQTKVLISDGGTTVIGGIFTVNEGTSETGVPWFRKLPVFGWLFKNKNITNENRELLIFITPKIMKIG
jgi:type IV pilus assembly protein PilQ